MLNSWHGTDKTGTRTIFIRAWTTYLGSPSTCKSGTAGTFIRAVPNFKCSVNGPLEKLAHSIFIRALCFLNLFFKKILIYLPNHIRFSFCPELENQHSQLH